MEATVDLFCVMKADASLEWFQGKSRGKNLEGKKLHNFFKEFFLKQMEINVE